MTDLLRQLAEPFPPEHITWKPGNTTKDGTKCMAMAYGDLRAYMERLDELCGLEWSVRYTPWQQERIICELTIRGVTRSSTGEYGTQDEKNNIEGTVAEAQAFKRACAMFGLGRYLYDLPSVWVAYDAQTKKISKEGQTELDNRYKAWYTKAIAASKQAAQNAPQTSQKAQEQRKDETAHESPPHSRMWGIGMSVFGDDWNDARPWLISKWSAKVTPDNTRNSTSELSDDEKTLLGDYMNEHVTTLQRVWRNFKAAQQQATAQPAQP